jgi:hypothetical protein
MSVSPTVVVSSTDRVDEHATQPSTVEPSTQAQSTEVLITTEAVLFGTAAARGVRRDRAGGRFGDKVRRFFATSSDEARARPRYQPRRYAFLEDALMSREMDRL